MKAHEESEYVLIIQIMGNSYIDYADSGNLYIIVTGGESDKNHFRKYGIQEYAFKVEEVNKLTAFRGGLWALHRKRAHKADDFYYPGTAMNTLSATAADCP